MLMLTVEVLERFPDALEKWQGAFRYLLVDEYQDTNRAQYRLLQLLAAEHRNVCAVGDPDQSIYAFRGADIRNILEFERDFGETRSVALEQNYRSTNSILEAANAVIANNSERKPKNLWSELGDGDPVRVIEVEDEHAEARFVATEVARLVEEGFSGRELAVFYRMNAQSRVLEQTLRLSQIPYQVIGGPRFYERAEIKDAIAYLQVIDNPADAISLLRIANRPRRGIGDTSLARLQAHADAMGISLFAALARPEDAGITGAPLRALQHVHTLLLSFQSAAQELEVPELLGSVLERSGMIEAVRGGADGRGARADREPRGVRGRGARVPDDRRRSLALRLPAGDLALLRPGRDRGGVGRRDADDAAQREGARVPRRLPGGLRGGDLPLGPLGRGAGDRGGAAPVLRRHDAGAGAADADRTRPRACSGAGRRTTCPRGSSTSCPRGGSSASGCGRPRGPPTTRRPRRRWRRAPTCRSSRPATPCATRRWARAS